MPDSENPPETAVNSTSRKPLMIGLVLGIAAAAAGFWGAWSGALGGATGGGGDAAGVQQAQAPFADVAFVEIDPLVISLPASPAARHLRFRAQLEVPQMHAEEVAKALPRVTDVLNSYLRALDLADVEDRAALTRLRAQMLRRVQVVTGSDRVRDVLIMEFVLT